MPPRQATSGRAVGSGAGPVTSQERYGAGPSSTTPARSRPGISPPVREQVEPGTRTRLDQRHWPGRHDRCEGGQQRGEPADLVGLRRPAQDRRPDRAVVTEERTAQPGVRAGCGYAVPAGRGEHDVRLLLQPGQLVDPGKDLVVGGDPAAPTRRSTGTRPRSALRTRGTAPRHRRTAPPAGQSASATYVVSRYSSIPSKPPSRPKPLAFTPPNGAAGFDTRPVLTPIMPKSSDSASRIVRCEVAGVDVRREAVLGVVRLGDGLVLGLERRDRRDRAEDLLPVDLGVVGYVDQDRRRVEEAGAAVRLAADHDRRTGRDRAVHEPGHRLDRLLVDERAHVGAVVLAAAEGERTHPVGELLGELVGDRGVHQEPVRGGAGLAHVAHLGEHRAVDRSVDVGVVEDQERRVAAELHADPLQLVGGLLDQLLPDPGGAGEADLAQAAGRP